MELPRRWCPNLRNWLKFGALLVAQGLLGLFPTRICTIPAGISAFSANPIPTPAILKALSKSCTYGGISWMECTRIPNPTGFVGAYPPWAKSAVGQPEAFRIPSIWLANGVFPLLVKDAAT